MTQTFMRLASMSKRMPNETGLGKARMLGTGLKSLFNGKRLNFACSPCEEHKGIGFIGTREQC